MSLFAESLGAVLALLGLALVFGAALGYAAVHFAVDEDPIVDQIDALLPQTQCGQCGHPGCHPYAEAIAAETDTINKCVPGGDDTIHELADLLGKDFVPLDGGDREQHDTPMVAFVIEEDCIGCTKCIQACPMDAILGSAKHIHTVIESECTGCDLCVEPCPVDCIELRPVATTLNNWTWHAPQGIGQTPGELIPVRNIA